MDFLKEALGDELYAQVETALKDNDKIKLANLADGGYVGKEKYAALETEKEALQSQLDDQNAQLEELKKVDVAALQAENEALKKVDAAALQAENKQLQDKVTLIGKGIPADKVDKYLKLAETYVSDDVDFAAATDLALKDFPVAADPSVPGAGGNPVPPANADDQKPTFASAVSERLAAQ